MLLLMLEAVSVLWQANASESCDVNVTMWCPRLWSMLLVLGRLKTGDGCTCLNLTGCWVLALLVFRTNLASF